MTSKLSSISTSVFQLKNSFAPINRLPPEILALIPTFRKRERDLIRAVAVCKYWRRTLISTHNLWNDIIYSERADRNITAPRVNAYFERSGSVPVKVQIPAHTSRFLSPYTERISWLRMFIGHPSNLDEIAKRLWKRAPLLERLCLRVKDWDQPTLVTPQFCRGISFQRELVDHPWRHLVSWTMPASPTHQVYPGNTSHQRYVCCAAGHSGADATAPSLRSHA